MAMKKIILFFMFIMLTSIVFGAVNTQYFGKSPNILVKLIKQEPDPVEPGKQVEVSFKIDNNGTIANNVALELVPEYPFSLLQEPTNYIGVLGTSQSEKQNVIVKYKLKSAQDAVDGEHQLKVRYKSDDSDSWVTLENFKLKVQSKDAIIAVEKFFTVPLVIPPGDRAKLSIELRNYATSLLKNIKVSLALDEVPFAPLGSTNEKIMPYIEPQANSPLIFDLLADSSALSKAYKIPLTITYSDILNKNYSKINLVTLIVGDKPNLGATLERTDIYTSDSSGNVVLRLVNSGNPDIKFLNVKVLQNENVKVIGANEAYVGKLDSDDFSTTEFKLFVRGKDSVKIPLLITYSDTNNNYYNENREVELRLYSNREAKKLGVKKDRNLVWIIAGLIITAMAYYYYKRKKH